MSFVAIEDKFPRNPKVAGLSDAAFRLHVTALCHCAEIETDGFVSDANVAQWAPQAGRRQKLTTELQEARRDLDGNPLWERNDTRKGWQVNGYLDLNPSREQMEGKRKAARDRMALSRANKANGSREVRENIPGTSREVRLTRARAPLPSPPLVSEIHTAGVGSKPADPFGESFRPPDDELPDTWAPNADHAMLAKRLGLDVAEEFGIYQARRRRDRYVCGNWDADFEGWLRQGAKLKRERGAKRQGGTATHGGPSGEWPTDSDLSLRERIRGGEYGQTLKRKLDAGELDAQLAKRLIRDRDQARADRRRDLEDSGPRVAGDAMAGVLARAASGGAS